MHSFFFNGLRIYILLVACVSVPASYIVNASAQTSTATKSSEGIEAVVVTGTLIQGNTNIVSPVTIIDTAQLDQRGISTIQAALQATNLNNGPAVTNNWTANGNFAQGASGISLRALSTNSTLVLFDGMRMAYYPLADDGIRNFVDLNTIPDDIVDNIQVLRDGASSSYGADAIAGVVNIITKKEFAGYSARAEGGARSDSGAAAQFRLSAIAGWGDLDRDRVNFYVSANYYHSDVLYAKNLPYPFNSSNLSNVCADSCSSNNVINGVSSTGAFTLSTAGSFLVRPYLTNQANQISTAVTGSKYQQLDGCAAGTSYTLTAAQQAANLSSPASVCQYDTQNMGGVVNPAITRFGFSAHGAFKLPSGIEGTVEGNFMQDSVSYLSTTPSTLAGNAPTGIYYPRFSTSTNFGTASPPAPGSYVLYLPAYVCAARVNCQTVNANGTVSPGANSKLNPNNPFAAQGYNARVIGRDWYAPRPFNETRDRTYRVAGTLTGSLFDTAKWKIDATASHIDLTRITQGYAYIQHLLDVVNDGTYNFVNPSTNSQSLMQYVYPADTTPASSDVAQLQATVTAPIYKLPGGALTLVAGANIMYEAVNSPSANSDFGGPTQRFFTTNAFGTVGHRDVYAAFLELDAPVFDWLTLNGSGRYDEYSSGQSAFSPKIGFNAKALDGLILRGSYSLGFRIPSFAESNALPTTGYVTNTSALFNNTYLGTYGCSVATFSTCPAYIKSGSYGLTTVASPNLKPENSRSLVFDVSYSPIDSVTLTTTYYNIKKSNAIANLDCSSAISAYYANTATPAGCTVVADTVDVNNPNNKARVAFVEAPLVNADSIKTSGFDFGAAYRGDISPLVEWSGIGQLHMTSSILATWINNLETDFPDGHKERYDGTLGNNNLTAGTGTPDWKGYWQTTFDTEIYEMTSTLNWISGYNLSAMDQGTGYRDCGLNDGSVPCRINDYFTWDLNLQAHWTPNWTTYLTINNVTGNLPPVDTISTYGITGYNVVVGQQGILGRYFKLGVKFDY